MVSTNTVPVKAIRKKPAADSNIFLEAGKTESRTMPCVVDKRTYGDRFCTTDELTRLMGYQLGSLKADTHDRDKEKMRGNAFHYQLAKALMV